MFWNDTFLEKRRSEWLKSIVKFQYLSNAQWFDAVITEKTIEGNTIKVKTTIADDGANHIIDAVRIIDKDGDVAGYEKDRIVKKATQGLLTLWEFPLYEVT